MMFCNFEHPISKSAEYSDGKKKNHALPMFSSPLFKAVDRTRVALFPNQSVKYFSMVKKYENL